MRPSATRWLLLFSIACTDQATPAPASPSQVDQVGIELSSVEYTLSSSAERVTPIADRHAVSLHTSQGYDVELVRAQLSNYSVELSPCAPHPRQTAPRGASLFDALVGLPTAHAGHTSVQDPSSIKLGWVEDLLVPHQPVAWGRHDFKRTRYCRLHYVIGAAEAAARKLPEAPGMLGQTLQLQGSYRSKTGETRPLSISSKLANGKIEELDALLHKPATGSALKLELERQLGSILDDLALDSASDKELERGAMRNLITHTRVRATLR